jgi:hypothetical protein
VDSGRARRCGERGREQVGGKLDVERRLAVPPLHERGFVEEQEELGVGEVRREVALDRHGPVADDSRRERERPTRVDARARQRDTHRQRTGDLCLGASWCVRQRACDLDEREESAVRLRIRLGAHGRALIERSVDGERTVVGDGDPRHTVQPLGDDALAHAAMWELRHGRQVGKATQDERRSGSSVAVRKTPDAGGHSRSEQGREHEIRSIRTPCLETRELPGRRFGCGARG